MQQHCNDGKWYREYGPKESTAIESIEIDCCKEQGCLEMLRKEFPDKKYQHFVRVQYRQKEGALKRYRFATDADTAKDLQDILENRKKCESLGKLIDHLRKTKKLISVLIRDENLKLSTPSKWLAVDHCVQQTGKANRHLAQDFQNASCSWQLDRTRTHAEDDSVSTSKRSFNLFSSDDFALDDGIGDVQEGKSTHCMPPTLPGGNNCPSLGNAQEHVSDAQSHRNLSGQQHSTHDSQQISDDRSDDIITIDDDPQPVKRIRVQRADVKTDSAAPRAAAAVQAAPATPSTKATKIARQLPAWLEGAVSAVPEAKPVGKAANVAVFTTDTVPNLLQPVVSMTPSEWLEKACRPKPVVSIAELKRRRGIR